MWSRRRRSSLRFLLFASAFITGIGLLILTLRSIDPSTSIVMDLTAQKETLESFPESDGRGTTRNTTSSKSCATVEEMGEVFRGRSWQEESFRVRSIIQQHFALNGASRVRYLPPEQFCKHGFIIGKASQAGFGNEMYKILNAAALSVMLNRSLIIGKTRHIGENIHSKILLPIPIFLLP